ncbi:MAG: DUF429 domain-containing protein [Beijerinckiaceae bacterium]|nr:DUF429 domain-containing protein [Beijerinckiaceae bacterium]
MSLFDRLIHSDWSVDAGKRFMACAARRSGVWRVEAPRPVGPLPAFLDMAFEMGGKERVLLGFDFPIGVPHAYGVRTGLAGFPSLLARIGEAPWHAFAAVAETADQISLHRPFYPMRSSGGVRRGTLVEALAMASFDDLHRVCERATARRGAASAVFWTLGGNQVGKAALTGWLEVIRPALARGARLWPYEGGIEALARDPGVVLAETYPAEAYAMVGAGFLRQESKRRSDDRRAKAAPILAWAERTGVELSTQTIEALESGFGPKPSGEDAFDALLGLLKMIEVAGGRRAAASEHHPESASWEGWILGR